MFIVYDKGTGRKGIIEDTEGEVTEIISYWKAMRLTDKMGGGKFELTLPWRIFFEAWGKKVSVFIDMGLENQGASSQKICPLPSPFFG